MRVGRGSILRCITQSSNHETNIRLTTKSALIAEWNFIPVAIGNAYQQNRFHSTLTSSPTRTHLALPRGSSLARSISTLLSLARNLDSLVSKRTIREDTRRLLDTDGHVMSSSSSRGDRPFTVVVEGNIGSGKTTLLQLLAAASSLSRPIETLQEPVSKWRDVKGHNTLGLMYEDPKRWSLTFQTYVQLTMVDLHTRKTDNPKAVKMMERSIYSAKYCFVENLRNGGTMPEVEYTVLTEWFDWLIANQSCDVDLIIYLRTSPEVVHDRVKKRSRNEESAIPLAYLRSLHRLHEKWLMPGAVMAEEDRVESGKLTSFPLPAPVMVLDGNCSADEMSRIIDGRLDEILGSSRECIEEAVAYDSSNLARLSEIGMKKIDLEGEEEANSQNQERNASSKRLDINGDVDERKSKVLKVLNLK